MLLAFNYQCGVLSQHVCGQCWCWAWIVQTGVHYGYQRGVGGCASKYAVEKWCGVVVYVVHPLPSLYIWCVCEYGIESRICALHLYLCNLYCVWQCAQMYMYALNRYVPELTGFSGLATSVVVLRLCGWAIISCFTLRFSQSILGECSHPLPPLLPSPLHRMPSSSL